MLSASISVYGRSSVMPWASIEQSASQVVGLQEALDEQIEYLDAMLPDYRWVGIDRGLNGGVGLSEYTPIFYRHAELSPIEAGNLTPTGGKPLVRPVRLEEL